MAPSDFWSDMISSEEEDYSWMNVSDEQVDVYRRTDATSQLKQQQQHPSKMLRMWRSVNSKVSEFYRYFHVIFGTAAYQPVQPSEHSIKTAKLLFRLLKARRPRMHCPYQESVMSEIYESDDEDGDDDDCGEVDEPALWAEVREILQECTELDSFLQVCNHDGFNVLLVAVLQQDREVLQVLIDEGVNLNRSYCTMPLHLACKIGDLQTVQLLLGHGAAHDVEAGMCYPRPHTPTVHVPSRFHFLETDIFSCDSNHALPLMYAIEGDHLDVVKSLLTDANNGRDRWPYHRHPLHHACHHGSYKSIEYLASHHPAELATTDEEGLTPLLHAAPWGQLCVKYLVEAGANVHSTNFKSQTALHVLFNQIQNPLELFGTTKFLLGTGMEQDVNRVDLQGNSPLHSLITQLNRKVNSYPLSSEHLSQEDYDWQIIQTMEILLQYNCDANRVNNSGVTALHKVILMLDYLTSCDPSGITLQTLPSREKYQVNFELVHEGLKVLLRHGADPNKTTSAGRTALIILLQMALNTDPIKLHRYGRGFLKCLSLLCEYGANPSRTLMSHINVVTLLCKIGHKCLLVLDDVAKQSMSEFYKEMLAVLLLHGLDSNHCSNRKRPAVAGASGNILLEMCKLGQCLKKPSDFSYIHDWVLTLIQWGANPDIEPYPSDSIICHSQSSIFLKPKGSQAVNQLMYEIKDLKEIFDGGYVSNLIMLFYNSMGHEALYGCLNTAKFLSRFDPNRAPHGRFLELIHKLSSQPRSLKQIARVSIYKSLNRQLNMKVDKLPLPRAMKVYLLEVQ